MLQWDEGPSFLQIFWATPDSLYIKVLWDLRSLLCLWGSRRGQRQSSCHANSIGIQQHHSPAFPGCAVRCFIASRLESETHLHFWASQFKLPVLRLKCRIQWALQRLLKRWRVLLLLLCSFFFFCVSKNLDFCQIFFLFGRLLFFMVKEKSAFQKKLPTWKFPDWTTWSLLHFLKAGKCIQQIHLEDEA